MVAMDTESEIVATITSDSACRRYFDDGVHDYHFADSRCRAIFSWAMDYFVSHGTMQYAPNENIISSEFPFFAEIVSETKGAAPSYLSGRLKNEYVKRQTEDILRLTLPNMQSDPLATAKMLQESMAGIVERCTPDSQCIEYGKDLEAYRLRVKEKMSKPGVPYPFPELTECTGGIRDGEMCVLVGPAGKGKSCFACKAALEALREGYDVYFASLELSIENIAQRIEYMVANDPTVRVPVMEYQKGVRLPEYEEAIRESQEIISNLPGRLIIEQPDIDSRTPAALIANCKGHGCNYMIVDQLQFVTRPKRDSLQESYGAALQEFKQQITSPADGVKIPMLLLHQMNREGTRDQRRASGKVGSIVNIAGSAWVEQIADIVWGIGNNDEELNNNIMNIATLKVRNTAPCGFMLHWDTAYAYRFEVVKDASGNPMRLQDWA